MLWNYKGWRSSSRSRVWGWRRVWLVTWKLSESLPSQSDYRAQASVRTVCRKVFRVYEDISVSYRTDALSGIDWIQRIPPIKIDGEGVKNGWLKKPSMIPAHITIFRWVSCWKKSNSQHCAYTQDRKYCSRMRDIAQSASAEIMYEWVANWFNLGKWSEQEDQLFENYRANVTMALGSAHQQIGREKQMRTCKIQEDEYVYVCIGTKSVWHCPWLRIRAGRSCSLALSMLSMLIEQYRRGYLLSLEYQSKCHCEWWSRNYSGLTGEVREKSDSAQNYHFR